jgi:hypothetical protein
MLETGTSGLMSGDEKRDDALPSAPALVLDSTMHGTRSGLTLPHTFRIWSDGEQLPFLRSACPGLDLYHREAAPGIPGALAGRRL